MNEAARPEDRETPIRVLIAKAGLDGHDRGAKIVARALRDAGMEVIYTGLRQTPEQIVTAAVQEDVAAIGISSLSGAHQYLFVRVLELMAEQALDDVVLFGGGVMPEADRELLIKRGVAGIFGPGSALADIVAFVRRVVAERQGNGERHSE
ncbi:MAG: cobalamin B12-binding domain-containing protein [Candidatus Schekmanbacteria bacterium]|nr:cobalamin B12-binding domain-containing protein [Candidatus Schekmanbacteria bacterium]